MMKQHEHVNCLRHDEVTSRDIPNLSDRRSYARSRSSNIVARFVDFNKDTGDVHYSVTSQAKAGKSYTVTFRFKDWNPDMAHLDDEIQNAVKGNIEIDCTCPAFTYQGYKFLASVKGGSVDIERRPPNETNPDRHGYACKHILKAIDSFNQDFDKFRAEGKGMIKKHNLRVYHKYERRHTLESSSSYSLSEKLDMRFMTYCDEVLGIHLSSLKSSSLMLSIAKALHDYMEQLMELCDLGNTYDALERVFATGNPKGFDEKNKDKYDRLVNTLKRHFRNLSGGVFEVHEARGGRAGHFPTDIRIEFGLDDGGTTLWTSLLRIPLTLCFSQLGQLRLLPDKNIADEISDWVADEISNVSEDWDKSRRDLYSDVVEESHMKTRRKSLKSYSTEHVTTFSRGFVSGIEALDKALMKSGYSVEITLSDDGKADFWITDSCRVIISSVHHAKKSSLDCDYDIVAWHYPKDARMYTHIGPSGLKVGETSGETLCDVVLNLSVPRKESNTKTGRKNRNFESAVSDVLSVIESDLRSLIDKVQTRFEAICKSEYHFKRVRAYVDVEDGFVSDDGYSAIYAVLYDKHDDTIAEVTYSFKDVGIFDDSDDFVGETIEDLISDVASRFASEYDNTNSR